MSMAHEKEFNSNISATACFIVGGKFRESQQVEFLNSKSDVSKKEKQLSLQGKIIYIYIMTLYCSLLFRFPSNV